MFLFLILYVIYCVTYYFIMIFIILYVEAEIIPEEPEKKEEEWWLQFVKLEHFEDMRVSSKLILLFGILKECEQIGDKVYAFYITFRKVYNNLHTIFKNCLTILAWYFHNRCIHYL